MTFLHLIKYALIIFIFSFLSCTKKNLNEKPLKTKSEVVDFSLSGIDNLASKKFLLKSKLAEIKEDKVFLFNPEFIMFNVDKPYFTLKAIKGFYNKKDKEFSFNSANIIFDTDLKAKTDFFIFKEKINKFYSPNLSLSYSKNQILGTNFVTDVKVNVIKMKKVKASLELN